MIECMKNMAKRPEFGRWIPVSERLPEDCVPVNITYVNHNPESYYANIKDVPFTATGNGLAVTAYSTAKPVAVAQIIPPVIKPNINFFIACSLLFVSVYTLKMKNASGGKLIFVKFC